MCVDVCARCYHDLTEHKDICSPPPHTHICTIHIILTVLTLNVVVIITLSCIPCAQGVCGLNQPQPISHEIQTAILQSEG